ncbi:MAG: hypothetical protein HYW77_00025 [Parcubacteria group bacterium]|nr:hypothetical protein [Parcubacteria group bacterium]
MNKGLTPVVIILIVLAVVAVGYFGVKKYVPDLLQPKQTPEDNIDTSGWKTYRNDQYGFEIKHPSQYKPTINQHAESDYWKAGVDVLFELGNDTNISIIVNPPDHGLCEGALEFSNDYSRLISGEQAKGIRCVYDNFVVEDYRISKNHNQFEINLAYPLTSVDKNTLDSILSTLKFID